jgi:hypothetical protein
MTCRAVKCPFDRGKWPAFRGKVHGQLTMLSLLIVQCHREYRIDHGRALAAMLTTGFILAILLPVSQKLIINIVYVFLVFSGRMDLCPWSFSGELLLPGRE